MKRFRQLGVLGLLLMISMAPAMACMAPDTQMTTQERVCCHMMKGDCGQMDMPASHECCQKAPRSSFDTAIKANTTTVHPLVHVVYAVLFLDLFPPALSTNEWRGRSDYSPPEPHPSVVSNLKV